jgi:DNA-binding CsgD family transcriptional regulator
MAGNSAMSRHAYEDALFHFERGVEVLGEDHDGRTGASLYLGKGLALARIFPFEKSEICRECFAIVVDCVESSHELALLRPILRNAEYRILGPDLIKRMLNIVEKGSLWEGYAQCAFGMVSIFGTRESSLGKSSLQRALEIAEDLENDDLEMRVHFCLSLASWEFMKARESEEHGRTAVNLSIRRNDPEQELNSRFCLGRVLLMSGRVEETRRNQKAIDLLEERTGERGLGYSVREALMARMAGNWQVAREQLDITIKESLIQGWPYYYGGVLELWTGHIEEAKRIADEFSDRIVSGKNVYAFSYGFWGLLQAEFGRVTGEINSTEIAEPLTRRAFTAPMLSEYYERSAQAALGMIAILNGEPSAAEEYYAKLTATAERLRDDFSIYLRYEPFGEFLGMYARAIGDLNESVEHWSQTRDAISFDRPRYAWACFDLARTLIQRNTGEDIVEAKKLLQEARHLSASLGMPPLERRARLKLKSFSKSQRKRYAGGLTPREIDVIRLVARGKTDQEIAAELSISSNTVSNHLSSIFRKTVVGNRTEAAGFAANNGLLEEQSPHQG